jgi:glycosyltransferase involved in cell wall biosynthesis
MMKTVALVDWNWMGHHPTYYMSFLKGFAGLDCRIVAICPESAMEDVTKAAETVGNTSVIPYHYYNPKGRLPEAIRSREHAWRQFGGLQKAIRQWEAKHRIQVDLVFFSTIYDWQFDNMHRTRGSFKLPWSGIYLHARAFRMPGSPMPYFNRLPCPDKIFTHPSMSSVCLIDEGAVRPMEELTKGKPAFEFPDITGTEIEKSSDGHSLADKLRRFAAGRKIVVCLGHLHKTKGLIELCKAANDTRTADIFFFFGGEVNWSDLSPDEARLIQMTWEQSPNVLTHLMRLSDETMNALIEASNVVFAAYTNFPNSSNVMTKAAMLERPIIVSNGYLMAERVRNHRLGAVVPEGSVEDITREICNLSDQGGDPAADYQGYYAKHSPEALQAALTKVIAAIPSR